VHYRLEGVAKQEIDLAVALEQEVLQKRPAKKSMESHERLPNDATTIERNRPANGRNLPTKP